MRKKYRIIIALGIFFIACAGWGLYLYNMPHRNVAGIRPTVQIDAAALCDEYRRDEAAADKRFVGKVMEVRGMVVESQLTGNRANVRLGASGTDIAVTCDLSVANAGEFPVPPKGTMVTVRGRCTGFLQDVNLVDCILEK